LHGDDGAIELIEFSDVAELSAIIRELIETTTPYELNVPQTA